jgi:hypothetical protein
MTRQEYDVIMDAFEMGIQQTDEMDAFKKFRDKNWRYYKTSTVDDLLISLSTAYLEGIGAGVYVFDDFANQPKMEELN